MLGGRGGGEAEKRLRDPAQLRGHLHLESLCITGDLSLIYGPTKFCYASLGDRGGGYKQERFQYVGEY